MNYGKDNFFWTCNSYIYFCALFRRQSYYDRIWSNKSNLKINTNEETENSLNDTKNLTSELEKLNELLKSGALTQEEFEKAKKKILDN